MSCATYLLSHLVHFLIIPQPSFNLIYLMSMRTYHILHTFGVPPNVNAKLSTTSMAPFVPSGMRHRPTADLHVHIQLVIQPCKLWKPVPPGDKDSDEGELWIGMVDTLADYIYAPSDLWRGLPVSLQQYIAYWSARSLIWSSMGQQPLCSATYIHATIVQSCTHFRAAANYIYNFLYI